MADEVRIYWLIKDDHRSFHFKDGKTRHFAPSAMVPVEFVDNLLTKSKTVGGCCGKPSRTVYLFATEEQLNSGEREYI